MHVYGPGVEGYKPVAIEIGGPPSLLAHETDFPEPKTLFLEAIRETVPVYEDRVRILKDVTVSPRFQGESISIPVTFAYQACDDRVCYLPSRVSFALEVGLVAHDRERVPETLRRKKAPSP
jgi:hypothetical protein